MSISRSRVNDYFDCVYVLNLEDRLARKLQMQRRLARLGIDAEFVPAVNGFDFHNRLEYEAYLQSPSKNRTEELRRNRKPIENVAAWGCLKSYENILEDAKANEFKRILCLEDDAMFHKNFEECFRHAVDIVPQDWKLFYLGATQHRWEIPEYLSYPDKSQRVADPDAPFYFPRQNFGTFACAMHSSVFDILLQEIRRMESPVDTAPVNVVIDRHPEECFVLTPNLIIADVTESDIRGPRSQQELADKVRWNLDDYDLDKHSGNQTSSLGPDQRSEIVQESKVMRNKNYQKHRNILIESNKAVLLLLPKTGCSSLKAQLIEPLGMEVGDDLSLNLHNTQHYPFPFADSQTLATHYRDYFRFTCVRNPWDRLVSCFKDKIRDESYNESGFDNGVAPPLQRFEAFRGGMSFADFVDAVCEISDAVADNHFRSQLFQLTDSDGNLLVNYIGRFEGWKNALDEINAHAGMEFSADVHLNRSQTEGSFRDYYDEKLVEKVRKRYFGDIHFLQYTFDADAAPSIGHINAGWREHFSRKNVLSFFLEEKCTALNNELRLVAIQNRKLTERLERMKKRLQGRKSAIRRIRQSFSWKVTAPLRKLAEVFKRTD